MLSAGDGAKQQSQSIRGPAPSSDRHGAGSATPAKTLRRACDCCRKRKVKCDGDDPCGPCRKASIKCAYLQPPQKKGPKGLRSAKVLRALRQIDGNSSTSTISPISPDLDAPWRWPQQGTSLYSSGSSEHGHRTQPSDVNQTRIPDLPPVPTLTGSLAPESTFARPTGCEVPALGSPISSNFSTLRLPGGVFLPYVELFCRHMFPIMPVVDRSIYLDPALYSDSSLWTPDTYCFICALCAATVVQLDASISQPPPFHPTRTADHIFADKCLCERRAFDYIESSSPLSVMTAFFLFAYYGNHEKHSKAWYFLQESITLAENLNMDTEESYAKLDPVEAQWRRRLYWLLFITERAYAVQRRKHTRLHAGIELPAVFESEDPLLLTGFVNLGNLFAAVGDDFVHAWRGSRRASVCDENWLAEIQKQLDNAALTLENVTEIQRLDISVTREWLHVLAWQMGVSNGFMWGRGDAGMRLDYPIDLARKVVEITATADKLALDSHGIGMEQKLSDIAGCLADVLRCTAGDNSSTFFQGKQYLHNLLQQLASRRGRESRYLQPLLSKMEGVLGYELSVQTLPLPVETAASSSNTAASHLDPRRLTKVDSVGMLRRLSVEGGLAISGIVAPEDGWAQQRLSGTVAGEIEEDWNVDNIEPVI